MRNAVGFDAGGREQRRTLIEKATRLRESFDPRSRLIPPFDGSLYRPDPPLPRPAPLTGLSHPRLRRGQRPLHFLVPPHPQDGSRSVPLAEEPHLRGPRCPHRALPYACDSRPPPAGVSVRADSRYNASLRHRAFDPCFTTESGGTENGLDGGPARRRCGGRLRGHGIDAAGRGSLDLPSIATNPQAASFGRPNQGRRTGVIASGCGHTAVLSRPKTSVPLPQRRAGLSCSTCAQRGRTHP